MQANALRAMWVAILAALFATVAALWLVGVQIRPGPKGLVLSWLAAAWLWLSFSRRTTAAWLQRMLDLGNGLLIMSAVGMCGALLSYWFMRVRPFSFADASLYDADLALGFDWKAIY
ncbi:hypothetical protein ABVV53_13195 [Novosphingobium sp. RD2P27]|uniref:Uncharacterized protein n=1 Tax=Novosphingobium kalidii TaxID=3230299 RepID=A0ABV2D3H3_9SPHN